MPAISKQIWTIDPSLDLSTLSEQMILSMFWQYRPNSDKLGVQQMVDTLEIQGKTIVPDRISLVDKNSRIMVRVREFVSLNAAQEFTDWCLQHLAPSVPAEDPVLFRRSSQEAVDNMTLEQFLENWPNN